MVTVLLTEEFQNWLDALRDKRAQARIAARLRLAEAGNLGDWKPVGGEVSEMRVDFGPGYRLYFTRRGRLLIVCSPVGTSLAKREIFDGRNEFSRNSIYEKGKRSRETDSV